MVLFVFASFLDVPAPITRHLERFSADICCRQLSCACGVLCRVVFVFVSCLCRVCVVFACVCRVCVSLCRVCACLCRACVVFVRVSRGDCGRGRASRVCRQNKNKQ